MNGRCQTCDVEAECGYPYKPTECCNYRKFRPMPPAAEVPKPSPAIVIPLFREQKQAEQP